jgi:hypothetical protein
MKTEHLAATLIVLVVLALAGCISSDTVQTTFDPLYPERNAHDDPILAVYEGRIVCAFGDCEMMKVTLVLYHNAETKAPTTYWLGFIGVGKGNDGTVTQGTWTLGRGILEYPEAVVYQLDANAHFHLRNYWRVNEDILLALDPTMRPKVGNSAWGSMLSRYAESYGPRTYPYDYRARRFIAPTGSNLSGSPSKTQ